MRRALASVVAVAILALLLFGCAPELRRPPCTRADLGGCSIDELDFIDNREISDGDLEESIATRETSRALAGTLERVPILSIIDALTVDYERFDRFVLERDLARIERYYRARGFYEARVRAGRVFRIPDERVRVEIVVDEGLPVKVASVGLEWKGDLRGTPRVMVPVTNAKNELPVGERFEEDRYEEAKRTILRAATDRGFAYASVEGDARVDLVRREAHVVYTVDLGPHCKFGPITIDGFGELPEKPLRTAIGLTEGEDFSTSRLASAERDLTDFGVFGAIEVRIHRSDPEGPPDPVVPITFAVQPAPLRSVRLGIGAEVGAWVQAHLVAGWEDRNFLGGLRRLAVEARPGLVFYPTRIDTLFDVAPTHLLPELRLRTELRQPNMLEAHTTGILRGAVSIYRLQTAQAVLEDPANANIVGYQEYAGVVGLERPFWGRRVRGGLYYNLQLNNPFSYNFPDVPGGFESVVISSIQTVASVDLRRGPTGRLDSIDPRSGVYFGTDLQLAGHFLQGSASDVRIRPEFRAYLPISRRVTLAFRVVTGLLFPNNYGDAFQNPPNCDALRRPELVSGCLSRYERELGRDLQLLQFRAFFSGGANSNRGYTWNGVGPHDHVPSLVGRDPRDVVPTGGQTLWESSVELRFPLVGSVGSAIFVDGSDVTRGVGDLRLSNPHMSAGFGLRYNTPVGPLRGDLGYRLPCLQEIGNCQATTGEGRQGTIFGLPIAISVAIGEAF